MKPEKVTSPSVLMGCREQDMTSLTHAWPRVPENPGGVKSTSFLLSGSQCLLSATGEQGDGQGTKRSLRRLSRLPASQSEDVKQIVGQVWC